jgi:hypothetical protein
VSGPAAKVNAPINMAHAAAAKTLRFILGSKVFRFYVDGGVLGFEPGLLGPTMWLVEGDPETCGATKSRKTGF